MKKDRTLTVPMQQVPAAEQGSAKDGLHQRGAVESENERSSKGSDLQDKRDGAYDSVSADNSDNSLPEGLQRERKGPMSPTRGRSNAAAKRSAN
jgi:hypothetical protein